MTEKIIVKREPKRNGGNLILFFPESYTDDYGTCIEYFGSVSSEFDYGYCHGDASYGYYRECKAEKYMTEEIQEFVERYARYIQTLPDMDDYQYKLVRKIVRK